MKPLTTWQVMSSIFKPQIKPTPEEIEKINSFFFCRYLSKNPHTLPISNILNCNYNMPIKIQYKFAKDYSDLVGMANKVKFISYSKDKTSPMMEKLLTNVKRKYKVSDEIAADYISLMPPEECQKIYELYEEGIQK